MDTKNARDAFTQLEALLGEYASEIMDCDLETLIIAAESAQEDVDELTDEDRAGCGEDQEFECEAELREALEAVKEGFKEVMEAIDRRREMLLKAEHLVNKAFGVDDGFVEEAEAA